MHCRATYTRFLVAPLQSCRLSLRPRSRCWGGLGTVDAAPWFRAGAVAPMANGAVDLW